MNIICQYNRDGNVLYAEECYHLGLGNALAVEMADRLIQATEQIQ